MAVKTINQYQTKTTIDDSHYILIGKDSTTKKIPVYTLSGIMSYGLVPSNYGTSNAGKVLIINQSGNVALKRM